MESSQKPSASRLGASYNRESEMQAAPAHADEPAKPRIQPMNGSDEPGAKSGTMRCGKTKAILLAHRSCAPGSSEVVGTLTWRQVSEAKRSIGLVAGMIALTLLWGTIAQAYAAPFSVLDGKDLQSLARLADDTEFDQLAVRDLWRDADSNRHNSRTNPYLLFKRMESWLSGKFAREWVILSAGREIPRQDHPNFRDYTAIAEPAPKWPLDAIPRPYPSQSSAYGDLATTRGATSTHLSLLDGDLLSSFQKLRPYEPGMPDAMLFSQADTSPCRFAGGGFDLQNSPGAWVSGNPRYGTKPELGPTDYIGSTQAALSGTAANASAVQFTPYPGKYFLSIGGRAPICSGSTPPFLLSSTVMILLLLTSKTQP